MRSRRSFAEFESNQSKRSKISPARWIGLFAILALLGLGGAWMAGMFSKRPDVRIVEIQKMAGEMQAKFSANGGPQNEAEAKELVSAMGQMREKIQALPEELRGQAMRGGMGRGMMAAQQKQMKDYFAAPPATRQAQLDKVIDREQMMMKAFASAAGGPGGPPGGGGGGGGGPPGGGGGGGGPPGGGGGPGGPGGNPEAFRKQMLDNTNPTQRAQFTEFRRAMDERRQQRGMTGGGGWGR